MAEEAAPAPLAESLLAADADQRRELVGAASSVALKDAIVTLAKQRTTDAAGVLVAIDAFAADKEVRKAARRETHRLRSFGVEIPTLDLAPAPAAPKQPVIVPVTEARVSAVDPWGGRLVYLYGDRPLGGAWLGTVVANDISGITELTFHESTRKRFRGLVDAFLARQGRTLADVDGFACHPGGAKVLDALEAAMDLPNGALTESREVLRDFGNMSAVTVLFVAQRMRLSGRSTLLTALGPGFSAAFMLLDG